MPDYIIDGLGLLSWDSLLWLLLGLFVGMIFGVLPGLGSVAGMAIVLPLTYGMQHMSAFAVLCGIYVGAVWGGSVTAIMLRIPGDAGSVATTLDGYEFTRQGRSRYALGASIGASVIGGLIGVVALIALLPVFGGIARLMDAATYFWIIVIALIFVAQAIKTNVRRGLISAVLGLMLATIGMGPISGQPRYTMGIDYLLGGLALVPLILGMFGVGEMLRLAQQSTPVVRATRGAEGGQMLPGLRAVFRHWWLLIRAAAIGIFNGAVPGLGAPTANLLAYTDAQRTAGASGTFGRGDIRGVIAPEAANNATIGPSLIPTLTLGVPGTVSAAVFMGALVLHGLPAGRGLVQNHSEVIVAIALLFLICSVLLFPAALSSVSLWARISTVPNTILVPGVIILLVFGVFVSRPLPGDLIVLFVVGVLAFFLERYGYSSIPLLIAFILGPILESNFQRALVVGDGSPIALVANPVHWALIAVVVLMIGAMVWKQLKRARAARTPVDADRPTADRTTT